MYLGSMIGDRPESPVDVSVALLDHDGERYEAVGVGHRVLRALEKLRIVRVNLNLPREEVAVDSVLGART